MSYRKMTEKEETQTKAAIARAKAEISSWLVILSNLEQRLKDGKWKSDKDYSTEA